MSNVREIEAAFESMWGQFKVEPQELYTPYGCIVREKGIFDFDDEGRLYELPEGEQDKRRALIEQRLEGKGGETC